MQDLSLEKGKVLVLGVSEKAKGGETFENVEGYQKALYTSSL